MATIFPSNPTVGQVYQSYEWDGEAWALIGIDFTTDYAVYPSQTGNSGKFLTTNGTDTSWGIVDLTTKANIASPTFTGTTTVPTLSLTTADTATAATHYMVETATDGIVRPKTLANTRTEIVTTAAVNSAAATTVGTVSSGIWQGTAISATYIDSAIARLSSPTFTGTPLAPTAAFGTNTTQLATTAFVQGAVDAVALNTQTSSYTLTESDAGTLVIMNVGSANNLTVPLNTSASFALGTQVPILQLGAGQTTVVAASGVTIRFTPGLKLRTQYSAASLIKIDTNTWMLSGDIVA